MHDAAHAYVAAILARRHYERVIEIGGRDINGGVRDCFTCDEYTSLDLEPGPGVDVVADATDWKPYASADLVICCEVLEHAPDPLAIVIAAVDWLRPDGRIVITTAGPGRKAHSGHDGGFVRPDEHYANIDPDDLREWLITQNLDQVRVEYAPRPADVYGTGVAIP